MIASASHETWTALDAGLALSLPILLAVSAFFSGSETALFGMNAAQRRDLARSSERNAALVLLRNPRMLLITLLLGNIVINTLFFVISSVLLLRQPWGSAGDILLPIVFLLLLVLLGEIGPKLFASSRPVTVCRLIGPPMRGLHTAILPFRRALDTLVIQPLSSLTVATPPERLSLDELDALVDASGQVGLVDSHEQALLADVLALGDMTVRDVMTPRTRMVTLSIDATKQDIDSFLATNRLMRIPIHGANRDDIRGLLHIKDWLGTGESIAPLLRPTLHVPEAATVDLALRTLRTQHRQTAIVVDEYGGTAGVVSLQDLVEPLVGEIADTGTRGDTQPRPLGPGRWVLDGDFPARGILGAVLGEDDASDRAATIAGLIVHRLGRHAQADDSVLIGNVQLRVHHVDDDGRIETVIVSLEDAS